MKVQLVEERQRNDYAGRRLAEFAVRCRASGLSVTPQRLAIIRALLSSAEHPSADAVYADVRRDHPHISLATVHRTLDTLCAIGEARKVTPLHDSARYDGNVTPHHHVVCVRCRQIRDVEVADADRVLDGRETIGDFHVIGTSVEILAVCGACRRRSRRLKNSHTAQEKKNP
jgi:Fur family peroxide stress response transcriptional regulator